MDVRVAQVDPDSWEAIEQYIHLNMTIDKLHEKLKASLAPVFFEEVSFWNDIINEVTPEEGGTKVAIPIYLRLRKCHELSIYNCAIEK